MSGRWGASRFGRQGSRPGWCQPHEAKLDPAPLRPSEDTSSRRGPAGTHRASPTQPRRRRRTPQPRPSCSRGKRRHNLLKSLPVDINFRAQLGKVRPNALTNKKTTKTNLSTTGNSTASRCPSRGRKPSTTTDQLRRTFLQDPKGEFFI